MKKQQGFTLIELLIVVAIIAIIAAIAVPNLLSARMAANETSAIGGLRAIGSAQVSYSIANEFYANSLNDLVNTNFLDARFASNGSVNGYEFAVDAAQINFTGGAATTQAPMFTTQAQAFSAGPVTVNTTGRYCYGLGADMVIRYLTAGGKATTCTIPNSGRTGDPVGGTSGSAS